MTIIRVRKPASVDKVQFAKIDRPLPGTGQILVEAAASSLNFH